MGLICGNQNSTQLIMYEDKIGFHSNQKIRNIRKAIFTYFLCTKMDWNKVIIQQHMQSLGNYIMCVSHIAPPKMDV